jgi:Holliday junction resolvase RusA-like endonuclease
MLTIELPIYFEKTFKTKASKNVLVNLNWFRNAHYFEQNKVKKHYHDLVQQSIKDVNIRLDKQYTLDIDLFYKNKVSDPSNIIPMMVKYLLDALQDLKILSQDNVVHHVGTNWKVVGKDTENPRVVIRVIGVK